MKGDFAVLILSCDKFSDLWPASVSQFYRYFPNDDVRLYVGSNETACDEPGVIPVLSGKDCDWSRSFKKILEQIEERTLAVIVDDYLLASRIDPKHLSMAVDFFFSTGAKHLKYWPNPPPDEPTTHTGIGQYSRGAPYRATVCGFWDRKYLMNLLLEGENAWDFEILGSYRTSYLDGFFALNPPLFECRNLVEKGYWIPQSVDWANKEGVMLDLDRRPILKGVSKLRSRLQMIYFHLMLRVPSQRRVRWMNTLRRLLISY